MRRSTTRPALGLIAACATLLVPVAAGIGATGVLALMTIGAGAAVATGHRPGARHNPQPIH